MNGGTTVSGGSTVLSAIAQQSFKTHRLPYIKMIKIHIYTNWNCIREAIICTVYVNGSLNAYRYVNPKRMYIQKMYSLSINVKFTGTGNVQ